VPPDAIAHSCSHAASAALASDLARRLGLRATAFSTSDQPDAALAVAPTSERRHGTPCVPIVVLGRRATTSSALDGRLILCGVRDEADAPAVATAAAIGETIGLPLLLIHVLPPVRQVCIPGAAAFVDDYGFTVEDVSRATEEVDHLVHAAGIGDSDADRQMARGVPGPTLAALASSQAAAMVVVSATARPWWSRTLEPSVTRHLGRHCDRPVLVCPRHPAPAMRVREALGRRARNL
jgi:nucleotide-binding universal stress UspA family protein